MDCRFVRRHFLEISSPAVGETTDAVRAARDHLLHCSTCRAAFAEEQAFDAALSRRLREIAVPPALKQRLLDDVAAHSPRAISPWPSLARLSPPPTWILAVLVLIGLLITPWAIGVLRSPTIELPTLLELVRRSDGVEDWPAAPGQVRPAAWSAVQNLRVDSPRRAPELAVPVTVARFEYWPRGSAAPVAGTLWTIESRKLTKAHSLSALEPAMQYGPRTSPFAWRENGYVFILDVREDAAGLHQLLRALFRSRTLV